MNYYALHKSPIKANVLARFATRAERDEWVKRINDRDGYESDGCWEAVTLRSQLRDFDPAKFDNDPWGDYCHEIAGERTSAGRTVCYILPRPSRR